MHFQPNSAMLSVLKLCTFLICLVLMHLIEADEVQELRKEQKIKLEHQEKILLQIQNELQSQLQRVHLEKLKLEQPYHEELDESNDSEYEYPSYCANCLGETLDRIDKNLLSSEFSHKVDSSTRMSAKAESRQLSDYNRLEEIKKQILLKLSLNEKPNVTSTISKQFILNTIYQAGASNLKYPMMMMQSDDVAENLQHFNKSKENKFEEDDEEAKDDFYAKTKEIIIFSERGQRINTHHILSFSTPINNLTQPNAKLQIRKATLWIMVTKSLVKQRTKAGRIKRHHHKNSASKSKRRTLLNTQASNVEFEQMAKKRRRRKRDNTNDDFHKQNFANHISNDKYNDDDDDDVDHINLSNSYKKREKAKKISDNTSTREQNITLWIFQVRNKNYTVDYDINSENFNDHMVLSTQRILYSNQDGLQEIDVTALVQNWYNSSYHDRLEILVDCSGCIANNIRINIPAKDKKSIQHNSNIPFLMLNIEPDVVKRSKRRAIDCSQAGKSQCCKQRFYVSFKTLGWDDWIIAPPGYYANYCRGDCGSGIRRTPDTFPTFYSHVFDELRKYNKLNGNQLCCAPLKFSSISLIYFGPDGSEIIKRDLPKMVVEECGCP